MVPAWAWAQGVGLPARRVGIEPEQAADRQPLARPPAAQSLAVQGAVSLLTSNLIPLSHTDCRTRRQKSRGVA